MNNRDLDTMWVGKFTAQQNAARPAEPPYRATQGSNFGWPYCFWDPAHRAPVDVMFYTGKQFPSKYKNGAFIAFHGSWNRAPLPQAESTVTFQPFSGGKPSGEFEVFAKGLSGKTELKQPNDAMYRADDVGEGPDPAGILSAEVNLAG